MKKPLFITAFIFTLSHTVLAIADTPWGVPAQVSPLNGKKLYHFPRTTTLTWQPVTGATSYKIERAYFGGSWTAYPVITVTPTNKINTSYTFNFIGDQMGRWRVTAYNGLIASPPSPWWTFSYATKPQMSVPILTNPEMNQKFSHFPRNLTLSWKMIPGAAGYKLERSYCQTGGINCVDYPVVTINDPLQSFYTFPFVGAQPGRWRVTALGGAGYTNSEPTSWRWFSFDR